MLWLIIFAIVVVRLDSRVFVIVVFFFSPVYPSRLVSISYYHHICTTTLLYLVHQKNAFFIILLVSSCSCSWSFSMFALLVTWVVTVTASVMGPDALLTRPLAPVRTALCSFIIASIRSNDK